MEWDWIDEDGEDIFDRMGFMVFGGSGWVASCARNIVLPSLSISRKIYRSHIRDYIYLIFAVTVLSTSYFIFGYLKLHRKGCQEPDSDEENEEYKAPAEGQEQEASEKERMRKMQEKFWMDVSAEQEK